MTKDFHFHQRKLNVGMIIFFNFCKFSLQITAVTVLISHILGVHKIIDSDPKYSKIKAEQIISMHIVISLIRHAIIGSLNCSKYFLLIIISNIMNI